MKMLPFWDAVAAAKPAHQALINHLMRCRICYAPTDRYCAAGAELHQAHRESFKA